MRPPPAHPPDTASGTDANGPPPAPAARTVPVGGDALRALHAALLDAFDLPSLRQLFLFELNRPLDTTVAVEGRTLDAVVTGAVRWALGAPGVGLHGLLAAAQRANPAHPGLTALAEAWRGVVFVRPACPYPGMRPFSAEEAGRFFGRAPEVQRALAALRLHPVLCVIGPSGSGKSSLALAGIVPALQSSTLFGPVRWAVAALRPGAAPADALAAALAGAETTEMESRPTTEGRLLLLVDQAEELFTLAGVEQRRAFEDALLALAERPGAAILLTVRSDYYTDLLTSRLWPLLRERLLDVAPLRGDALRDAIVHPAADVGVTVDPALAERLLADAGDEAGVLPFIQETMVLLWDQAGAAGGFTLALDAYAAAVGARTGRSALEVALGGRADAAYLALDDEGQRLARRTFLRLIQFGEGRPDVRRRQCAADLAAAHDDPAALARVLDHLVAARLLTAGSDPAGARTVDLAHEALLIGWARLAEWARERKDAETARRRLEEKAAEWVRLGGGEGGLLDAAELAEADAYLHGPDAADLGASEAMERHVAASRHALNPGWQPRGALLLAGAALALALLAGVGINALLGSALAGSAVVTIGVATVMLALLALVALRLLRRADRFVVQRWTHALAARRRRGLAVAGLVAVVLVVLAGTATAQARLEQRCAAYGLDRSAGTLVAVVNSNADPAQAELFASRFDNASPFDLHAALVTAAQADECRSVVSHRVDLRQAEAVRSAETTIYADLYKPGAAQPFDTVQRAASGPDDCAPLLALPYEVLTHLGEQDSPAAPPLSAEPPSCAAAVANEDGLQYYYDANYVQAEAILREAVRLAPTYAEARNNLGLALVRLRRPQEAVAEIREALKVSVRPSPLLLGNLALACYYATDMVCAEEYYRAVITDGSDEDLTAEAYNGLGIVLIDRGDFDAARAELATFALFISAGQPPRDYEITLHKNRGVLAYRAGDLGEAKEEFEIADRLQTPTWKEHLAFNIAPLVGLKNARRQFETRLQKFDEEIVYHLAKIAQGEGDSAQACALWARYFGIRESWLLGRAERELDAVESSKALGCGR